jgi:hypothetical protein
MEWVIEVLPISDCDTKRDGRFMDGHELPLISVAAPLGLSSIPVLVLSLMLVEMWVYREAR